ncbi:UNVERIFIED_CONTAM: hypothetical protein K2H54_057031 [Gekko kuhli]
MQFFWLYTCTNGGAAEAPFQREAVSKGARGSKERETEAASSEVVTRLKLSSRCSDSRRLRLPPDGERALLGRRGDGERRDERLLDGERRRRPRGEGERERRGLRPRVGPDVEAPERELREPELLLSLDRLEDDRLDRPLLERYMATGAAEAAFSPSPVSSAPTPSHVRMRAQRKRRQRPGDGETAKQTKWWRRTTCHVEEESWGRKGARA